MKHTQYIEENTIRCEASYRGGGIEINLSGLLPNFEEKYGEEPLMTAYQNYLGGGMLGKINGDTNFDKSLLSKKDQKIVDAIQEELKQYFHDLTNHEDDEWENQSYEQNQNMPTSAY